MSKSKIFGNILFQTSKNPPLKIVLITLSKHFTKQSSISNLQFHAIIKIKTFIAHNLQFSRNFYLLKSYK